MSQIFKSLVSGPVPPAVPTSFVTDINSPSVPIANIENVFGGFVSTNSANGIQTDGSSGSNTLTIELTNRLRGSGTTVGATNTNLVIFALGATPATYIIDANFAGFEPTTPAGVGYSLFGSVRTDGATATLVGTPDKIKNEEAALAACDANIVVSGNNVILQVTGTAGLTVDWVVVATYVRVT